MSTTKDPDGTIRDKKTGRLIKGVAQKTNKNGTAGKPTAYKPEYVEQMLEFFSKDAFTKRVIKSESTFGKNGSKTEYMVLPEDLPTFQGFAKKIGVTYFTLRTWAEDKLEDGETRVHPEFSDAYTRAQDMQHEMLVVLGLNGLYNPVFAKFIAQNYTEMRDKQAIDHTTQGKALPAPMVYLPEDLPDDWFENDQRFVPPK